MAVSGDTVRRVVMQGESVPLAPTPRVVGVNDGRGDAIVGTLLIDLERRRVVDVLPDRRPPHSPRGSVPSRR